MGGNNGLKFIAVAVLLEYVFVKPRIIPNGDGTDFIGFVLVHALLAYIGRLNIQYLTDKQRSAALANGGLGGAFGYAWLLFHVKHQERQVHHLFVTNLLILVGIVLRAVYDRRLNRRDGRKIGNPPMTRASDRRGRGGGKYQPDPVMPYKQCCGKGPVAGVGLDRFS